MKNWFEGVDENGELPEMTFNEGYYSVRDFVSEILTNEEAAEILVSAINTYGTMKTKRSMLGILSGVPVEDLRRCMPVTKKRESGFSDLQMQNFRR